MNKINGIEYSEFDSHNKDYISQASGLLIDAFPQAYNKCANEEMNEVLKKENITIMAVKNNMLLGFVGAKPVYSTIGWELHPLVVKKSFQRIGIGKELVRFLEKEVKKQGGITIYLGTDDENNATSLSNTDLYTDTFDKIKNISNSKNHPYEFYEKQGYKIVGVLPDVNGIGKPDIWMAKKI